MSEGQIGVRLDPGLRTRVMENVGVGKPYRKITDFIIAAIEEKLNQPTPEQKEDEEKRRLIKLLEDPDVQKYLSKK